MKEHALRIISMAKNGRKDKAMKEKTVSLAQGAGGKQTSALISGLFKRYFDNEEFTADDAAVLHIGADRIAMTTDGFVVSPYEFPGGNIGKLSICGTVNDLTCMGAKPLYLTCAFIIEEGFSMEELERIVQSMAETAKETGVRIVAGDTKVVARGQADHIFITTTGIGVLTPGVQTSGAYAKEGDAVIVTGDVGRHGCTILLEREELGIHTQIESDCAPLWKMIEEVLESVKDVHVIRDATRGGVGNVLYEIAEQSQIGICLEERRIPVHPNVRECCSLLGMNPLYLANEGTMVIVAPQKKAEQIMEILKKYPYGQNAAVIGRVSDEEPGMVTVVNEIGVTVILPQPLGELLPRIC